MSWCIFKTIHQCVFEDVISPTTPIQDAFHGMFPSTFFNQNFINQPTPLGNNDEKGEHNRYDRLSEAVNSPANIIQIEDKIEDPTDKIILKTMLKFTRVSFNLRFPLERHH